MLAFCPWVLADSLYVAESTNLYRYDSAVGPGSQTPVNLHGLNKLDHRRGRLSRQWAMCSSPRMVVEQGDYGHVYERATNGVLKAVITNLNYGVAGDGGGQSGAVI